MNDTIFVQGGQGEIASGQVDSSASGLRVIGQWILLAVAFLLPVWALPFTSSPFALNKAYLAFVLVIIAAILWLVSTVKEGRLHFVSHPISLAVAGLVVANGIGLVFSKIRAVSFFHTGAEVGTFGAILLYALIIMLASLFFPDERRIGRWFNLLFLSSVILFVIQFFWSGLGVRLLPFSFFADKNVNLIGSWNVFGIFFGFTGIAALALFTLNRNGGISRKLALVTLVLSLVAMAFVNFSLVWWVFAVFTGVFLVYRFVAERDTRLLISLPLFILLIALLFLFIRGAMGDVLTSLNISNVEVRPSWGSTLQVAKSTLKQDLLVGTGPQTFLYNWLQHHPVTVNQTPFWSARFEQGVGTIPSLAFSTGLLGILSWLIFLAFFLWFGLKAAVSAATEARSYLLASFLGSAYLWTITIVYAVPFVIMFLAFFSTGIFVALLLMNRQGKQVTIPLLQNAAVGFVSALAVLFFIILGFASLYFLSRAYIGAEFFARGLDAFNTSGDVARAESLLDRARRLDNQDTYSRALTEIKLVQLRQIAQGADFSSDAFRVQFQNLLGLAIQNANAAKDANPLDPQNWLLLGRVYESVLPLGIGGADEFAQRSYEQSAQLAPSDPGAPLALARVLLARGDRAGARTELEKATTLKSDYAPAQFLLSQVAAQEGNIQEAVRRTESTALLAPNDIGVLFQLGLLYYQSNNITASQQVFERLVAQSPDYSNARYFLGLAYDRQGRTADAIGQFERIEELNPNNTEVKQILDNLRRGRTALAGISPPAPSPEQRPALPVPGQ